MIRYRSRVRGIFLISIFVFSFFSYESLWNYLGIRYNAIIEFYLAILVSIVLMFWFSGLSRSTTKTRCWVTFLFFPFLFYSIFIVLFVGISRLDLFIYVVFTQATLVVVMGFLIFLGPKLEMETVRRKINRRFFCFFVFSVAMAGVVVYMNNRAGGAHKIFNHNWVVIGLISLLILFCVDSLRRRESLNFRTLTLPFFGLTIVASYMGSLGGAMASALLLFLCFFNSLGYRVFCLSFFVPLIFLIYFSVFSDFKFFWINDYMNDVLGSGLPIDYSSGRFASWDLAVEKFRSSPYILLFGGGVDNASNLYFSAEGVTASGHNYWVESVFRVGLFGVFLGLSPFFFMYLLILNARGSGLHAKIYVLTFVSMMALGFFYDIGGFTHLPGTFFFKGVLCCIFSISICKQTLDKPLASFIVPTSSTG